MSEELYAMEVDGTLQPVSTLLVAKGEILRPDELDSGFEAPVLRRRWSPSLALPYDRSGRSLLVKQISQKFTAGSQRWKNILYALGCLVETGLILLLPLQALVTCIEFEDENDFKWWWEDVKARRYKSNIICKHEVEKGIARDWNDFVGDLLAPLKSA